MVRTHTDSRFRLMTLAEIRDSRDVILQTEDAEAKFDNGQKIYLCEVVGVYSYNNTPNTSRLTDELIKVNGENRRLRDRIHRLERQLGKR